MNDDGYTLAEMLAALAILGLAIGGLGLVVSLISRQQWTAQRLHDRLADARAADRALDVLFANELAAGANLRDLQGDTEGLSFTCGTARCAAQLRSDGKRTLLLLRDRSGVGRRLRLRARNLRFSYVGASGASDGWPAPRLGDTPPDDSKKSAPRTIILRSDAAAPLAVARIEAREPRDCRYDTIAAACRATPP